MKYFAYIITHDVGFAPNPFYNVCTLATCKPNIRQAAQVGDWVFGLGSKRLKCRDTLIFAMQVSEKLSFNEYWNDPRFLCKRPGRPQKCLKQKYGDNIYHKNNSGDWQRANSYHCLENGLDNQKNLKKDTKADHVLISDNFYYFGSKRISLSEEFAVEVSVLGPNFKYINTKPAREMLDIVSQQYKKCYLGKPIEFAGAL